MLLFNNAKTDITTADKNILIASLKSLSEYKNLEETVDIESVIRYFIVHNYVCNGDSYTGAMIHNYYLYEEDGMLSMIPWDYNLAFGTFQSSNATSTVNSPIDTPVSGGSVDDRPMLGWIFSDEKYTDMYHKLFGEFMESVDIQLIITKAQELIAPYVEKDPTKFCTYDEFLKGVDAIKQFCALRSESITGQLNGTIPSTTTGQSADKSAFVDAAGLVVSDMGTMGMGGFGGDRGERPGSSSGKEEATTQLEEITSQPEETTTQPEETTSQKETTTAQQESTTNSQTAPQYPQPGGTPPDMGDLPEGFDPNNMPDGFDFSNLPEGFDFSNMPEGFDFGNMPGGGGGKPPAGFDLGSLFG